MNGQQTFLPPSPAERERAHRIRMEQSLADWRDAHRTGRTTKPGCVECDAGSIVPHYSPLEKHHHRPHCTCNGCY